MRASMIEAAVLPRSSEGLGRASLGIGLLCVFVLFLRIAGADSEFDDDRKAEYERRRQKSERNAEYYRKVVEQWKWGAPVARVCLIPLLVLESVLVLLLVISLLF